MNKQADFKIVKLNLARHCLNYIIAAYDIKELHIPYYICPALWQNINRNRCKLRFYHINDNFYPLKEFKEDDFILYPDYFGINGKNVQILAGKYKNLIVDNAQAFFAPPRGIASFYSLRKFFPVQCGAYLYTRGTADINYPIDTRDYKENFTPDYTEFVENELFLNTQPPLMMSESIKLPANLMKEKRLEKFRKLHKKYGRINRLNLNLTPQDVPFVYPCLTDNPDKLVSELESQRITVLRYWDKIPESYPEYKFYSSLVPIPL